MGSDRSTAEDNSSRPGESNACFEKLKGTKHSKSITGLFSPLVVSHKFGVSPPSRKIARELWKAGQVFISLSISAFPSELKKAFYDDHGPEPKKW